LRGRRRCPPRGTGGSKAENGISERADHDDVGIARVHDDGIDVANVSEADAGPGGSGIAGFINAIAVGLLAGADVDDVGIRGRDSDGSDRRDVLIVKDRLPDAAGVGGLPHTSARRAHVIDRGISRNAGNG